MKKTPPISMTIAVVWLVAAGVYGLFKQFSILTHGWTGFPYWPIAFIILGIANCISLAGFLLMKPWSILMYYTSTSACLIAGIIFHATQTQFPNNAVQLAGTFAGHNISGLLLFTIAFLPYRKHFRRRSNQGVQQDASSAGAADA